MRETIEDQWNRRTPISFVGWEHCSDTTAHDVAIMPIDSGFWPPCGRMGQSCVPSFGQSMRGKIAYLNLFFGDEFIYTSRYQESAPGALYDPKMEPNGGQPYPYWLPLYCVEELKYPWSHYNRFSSRKVDIDSEDAMEEAKTIIERCLKTTALHEFGHIVGLSHEQYQPGEPEVRDRCMQFTRERGILADLGGRDVHDLRFSPVDTQSIMSNCRLSPEPALAESDIAMVRRMYGTTN